MGSVRSVGVSSWRALQRAGGRLCCVGALLWAGCATDPDAGWISYGPSPRPALSDGGAATRRVSEPRYVGSFGVVGPGCASLSVRADPADRIADVVMAIDTSGSMTEEIGFVQEQLNAFSRQIADADVGVRLVLISAPASDGSDPDVAFGSGICVAAPLGSGRCPDDSRAPDFEHIFQVVGSNDALDLILAQHPVWSLRLRPRVHTAFVVISDDDALGAETDPSEAATDFLHRLDVLDPTVRRNMSFHAIYSFQQCPEAARVGQVYRVLVGRTGGVGGDLCQQEFQPVFDRIAASVVAGASLGCDWAIPEPPEGEAFLVGQVSVRYTPGGGEPRDLPRVSDAAGCAGAAGWHYDDDDDPQRIVLCGASCQEARQDVDPGVDLVFGCDPAAQPD